MTNKLSPIKLIRFFFYEYRMHANGIKKLLISQGNYSYRRFEITNVLYISIYDFQGCEFGGIVVF